MEKQGLPTAFWILIGVSAFVGLILAFGTFFDEKKISEIFKEKPAPTASSGVEAVSTPEEAYEPKVEDREREKEEAEKQNAEERKKNPDGPFVCEFDQEGEISIEGPKLDQLLGWSRASDGISYRSLDGEMVTIRLAFQTKGAPKQRAPAEIQTVLCKNEENATRDCIRRAMFRSNPGAVRISTFKGPVSVWRAGTGEVLGVLEKMGTEIGLKGPLGRCGKPLHKSAEFTLAETRLDNFLVAIEDGLIHFYSTDKWMFSTLKKAPSHPDYLAEWNGRGWDTVNCGERGDAEETMMSALVRGAWILALVGGGAKGERVILSKWTGATLLGPLWSSDIEEHGSSVVTMDFPRNDVFSVGYGSGFSGDSSLTLYNVAENGNVKALQTIEKTTTPRILVSREDVMKTNLTKDYLLLEGRSTLGFSKDRPKLVLEDEAVADIPSFSRGVFGSSPDLVLWSQDTHREHYFLWQDDDAVQWRRVKCHY